MQPVMVHSPIMAQGIRWRAAPWLQSVRAAAPSWASTVMVWEAGAQSSAPAKAAACPAAGRTASSTSSNMALSLASISVTSKQFVRRNFDLPQDRHSAPSNAGRVKTYRCPGRAEQIHGPPDLRPPRGTQDVSSGTRLRSGDLLLGVLLDPFGHFFDLRRLLVDGLLRHLPGLVVLAMLQFDSGHGNGAQMMAIIEVVKAPRGSAACVHVHTRRQDPRQPAGASSSGRSARRVPPCSEPPTC